MSEIAIIQLNDLKVRRMAEAGNRKAASGFSEPLAAQFLQWFPTLTKAADVVNGAAMVGPLLFIKKVMKSFIEVLLPPPTVLCDFSVLIRRAVTRS
ncbi:MAG: hypothetical protein IJW37_06085 [Lachnospiraceae bacterium]|nr:hypothetical protein [Lachnospiraceae bacterium]